MSKALSISGNVVVGDVTGIVNGVVVSIVGGVVEVYILPEVLTDVGGIVGVMPCGYGRGCSLPMVAPV
jgi:hypothetical protein